MFLKFSNLENFRALKLSNLARRTTSPILPVEFHSVRNKKQVISQCSYRKFLSGRLLANQNFEPFSLFWNPKLSYILHCLKLFYSTNILSSQPGICRGFESNSIGTHIQKVIKRGTSKKKQKKTFYYY